MSTTCIPALRKLDYLSFTLPDGTSHSEIFSLLNLKFQELGFGRYRYKQSAVASAGGVSVYWDGAVTGMGVHVQISGTGCRILESLPEFCSWRDYIKEWLGRGAKCSRIDIALDDESGAIAFQTVHDQVRTRTAVMRSSYSQLMESTTKKGTFQTLYVGRRSSETVMRCYDKGMQKGEGSSWLRFEFEYKGKRADALARLLVDEGWDKAVGVARSFIEFKDETHITVNRTDQRPADWWVQLISASKHVLCVSREAHESLVKSWSWLRRQVAPMLGVMMEHEVGDLSWFLDLVDDGRARFNERHRRLLQAEGELPPLAAVMS
jgi:phage replication initiation protein